MSRFDTIEKIWIDGEARLHVRPTSEVFPMVYRAAMEVYWDAENRSLFSPKPQEWSYLNWFNQIVAAAKDEYGIELKVAPTTVWQDISDELRDDILLGRKSS